MTRPELGTKRIDPETGKKFYDLNRDPVVSPYTGKSYPLSYFTKTEEPALVLDDDIEPLLDKDVEFISLEEAEKPVVENDDIANLDEENLHDADNADDVFLAVDEADDVADLVGSSDLEEEL